MSDSASIADPDCVREARVLVVSDGRGRGPSADAVLDAPEYEVWRVETLAAARDRIAYDLDAVVVDWDMGEDTAYGVLGSLVRRGVPCEFMLIAAARTHAVIDAARNARAMSFLEKPLDPEELGAAVNLAARVAAFRRESDERADLSSNNSAEAVAERDVLERALTPAGPRGLWFAESAALAARGVSDEDAAIELGLSQSAYRFCVDAARDWLDAGSDEEILSAAHARLRQRPPSTQ